MAEQIKNSHFDTLDSNLSNDEQDLAFYGMRDDIGGIESDFEKSSKPTRIKVFLSKTDEVDNAQAKAMNSTVTGPDLSHLWAGPESPGPSASYTSASFESLHSEELNESCPLIFSVDDVVRSHQNDQIVPRVSVNGEVVHHRKGVSDTSIPIIITESGNVAQESSSSSSKDTTTSTNSSDLRSDFNLTSVFSDQKQNLGAPLGLKHPYSQSSSSEDSLTHSPRYNFQMKPLLQGSPEYLVKKLDDQISELTDTLEEVIARDRPCHDEQNGGTADSSKGVNRDRMSNVISSTLEAWKQFRVFLLDLMGETDYLETRVQEVTGKLQVQGADNLRLRCERRDFQTFLEEKEREWRAIEKGLKTELDYLNGKLFDISQSNMDWGKETKMVEALMDLQYDREQGIILDTAKQNKMNEFRLLIFKQQLLIEELHEDNTILQQQISSIKSSNPELQSGSKLHNTNYNNNDVPGICDVLYCDRYKYLPSCSHQPELASLQVFNIGGRHPKFKTTHEEIFQPLNLIYNLPTKTYDAQEAHELYNSLIENGPGSAGFSLNNEQG